MSDPVKRRPLPWRAYLKPEEAALIEALDREQEALRQRRRQIWYPIQNRATQRARLHKAGEAP